MAVIVILAIAIPPLLMLFSEVTRRSTRAELISTGISLGRSLLEEIISKNYDERTESPWSNPLGPDPGETDRDRYDDVDDFDGLNETSITNFPAFSRRVSVYYINPDLTSSEPPYHLDIVQPDSSNTLDYKRVDVVVAHYLVGEIRLSCVVSRSHF